MPTWIKLLARVGSRTVMSSKHGVQGISLLLYAILIAWTVLVVLQTHKQKLTRKMIGRSAIRNVPRPLYFEPDSSILNEVDCKKIIAGDENAIERAAIFNLETLRSKAQVDRKTALLGSQETLIASTQDCEDFKTSRKYIRKPMTAEETAYPIAYIVTIHRDILSFERLLRTIYHPQNVYCIHPDKKADDEFQNNVRAIVNCFDNVFIASKTTSVQYTHISRVQADLNCLEDLVNLTNTYPWRYVINLCGQDFPLRTNLEMVRHLKSLAGYNNLETFHTPAHKKGRFQLHFDVPDKGEHSVMKRTEKEKTPPPGGIEIFAGSAYFIFKRKAAEYIISDPLIQELITWSEDTYSPDEFLWATIQRMYPDVPGSFPHHEKYDLNELISLTRLVKWEGLDTKVYPKCYGAFVRGICVYGVGDLPWLISQKHLFANKFDPNVDFSAIHCLENYIRNKTLLQTRIFNSLGFV